MVPTGTPLVFATYAESDEELKHVSIMIESLRLFGGAYREAPVRVWLPDTYAPATALRDAITQNGGELFAVTIPEQARWFYYAGKTYAAGLAESSAAGQAEVLVWMDEDTVVLREPSDLRLPGEIDFGYRPVMHNRSGSLYDHPPGDFWAHIYELLKLSESNLFPMTTPADRQVIRAYFNAGLLAVRPRAGILQRWARCFEVLYNDPDLAQMCRRDLDKRIFLHQTALVGAALEGSSCERMLELPLQYNYPLFFERMFDAVDTFTALDDIVTLRYDVYFRNPDPAWADELQGSAEKIQWLRSRLG